MPSRPNFPIPEDIHAEPYCLQLMIPNDPTWKQVVAGLLDELNQWYNWQRDEERSGKECAQVWRGLYAQIDWSIMSCCCDQTPVRYRYLENGKLQSSTDGGATWEDAPNEDIRITAPQFPPVPGAPSSDKKCVAATGMSALIKSQVGDQLTDDMTRYTLDQLVRDWTGTYIGTSNPFKAFLTVAVNQIFAIGIALLRAALTDAVYDILTCTFFCNIEDDLSFTEAGKAQVITDIGDLIGGIATLFLQQLVNLLGIAGLTNLARSYGAAEGDCGDCDCPVDCWANWSVYVQSGDHFGEILEVGDNFIIAQTTNVNTNGKYYIYLVTPDIDQCCYMNSYEVLEGSGVELATGNCGAAIGSVFFNGNVGQCVNQLQPQSGVPFKIKFNLAECP